MKKGWMLVIALFIVIVFGVLALVFIPGPKVANAPSPNPISTATPATNPLSDLIVVSSPSANATVRSPLVVSGNARGNWYFEATFPIELTDASGKILAQGVGRAQSEWTTTDFVPFKATLSFSPQPAGSHGTLVLSNDNPSGDPAKQKSITIPVTF